MSASVTTELHSGSAVHVITLSDPAKLNAIGDELRAGLHSAVNAATSDAQCRVMVITGANEAFSAGGELSGMPTDPEAIRLRIGTLHGIVRALIECDQVVISAVDGVAFGSGMSFAAAADIVVASERARFGCTFGRVGLIPDVGWMWTVPRRIGLRRARLMVLQNEIIDADEALACGLADYSSSAGLALDRAIELATQVARTPAVTLANAKRMLGRSEPTLDAILQDELARQIELLGTAEFTEARNKFLSRKK